MKWLLCVVVFVALCSHLGQAADTCKHANKKIGEDIQFKDLGINCVLPLCCLYKSSEAYAKEVEAPLSPLAQSFNKMSLSDKNLYCMVFMMSKPQIPSCGTLVAGLSDFRGNAKTNYIDTAHALMAHSLENVNDALFGKSEAHWIVPLYSYMRNFYFSGKSLCRTPDDLQSYISTLNPPKPDSVYSVGSWAIKPDAKTDLLIAADVIKTAAGCIGIEINDKKFTSFTCTELISMISRINQGPSPFWMNKGNIPYPLAHLMPEINRVVKQLYADAMPQSVKVKPKLTLSKPNFSNCEKEPTITFSCMDFTPIYEKKSSEAGKCDFSD